MKTTFSKPISDVHQHHGLDDQVLFLKNITLSSISKFSSLNPSDYEKLKPIYTHLYGTEFSDDQMVRTIRVYKIFNQRLGAQVQLSHL